MSIALDYTKRIPPRDLFAAGVSDVFRYLCFSPVGDWKNITQAEFNELYNAGIGVTLNWEFRASDWNNGESVGYEHGRQAIRMARNLGYRMGCTIFGSADYDMPWSDWNARGRFYARGFADAIRQGGYEPGVYGPWNVLQWCQESGLYQRFWQAGMSTAWSGGKNRNRWPGAHVRQRRHMTVGGVDTDLNDIHIPNWGQMRKGGIVTVEDWGAVGPPKEEFLKVLRARGMGSVFEADMWYQEVFGFSPWDGVSPTHRSKLLTDIKAGIDALSANPPVPSDTVSFVPEDRARLDRLTEILGELASHLKHPE